MAGLSTSTWGDPTAAKRVLLLHGLTGSSQGWYHIAQKFTSQGCFVTAPDLLGHGTARRGSSDYTVSTLADELRPFFSTGTGDDHPYDIVVGHSLGGVVASALLPLLKSSRPVQVVLVDPPFEVTPENVAMYRHRFTDSVRNPQPFEALHSTFPSRSKEDTIFFFSSLRLCDIAAVEAIMDQNDPWSFSHLLAAAPDNVKLTVLAADPSKAPCAREEEFAAYPHVTVNTIWGASHLIPFERPEVVVETALGNAGAQNLEV